MIRALIVLVVTLCAAVALVACQTPQNNNTISEATPAPVSTTAADATASVEIPGIADSISLTDTGGVIGRVLSITDSHPLADTPVWLAQVTRGEGEDGAYVLNSAQSPANVTDPTGQFLITNAPPAEYVIIVGDPYGAYEVIKDPETTKAATYFVEQGNITRVGDLIVDIGK